MHGRCLRKQKLSAKSLLLYVLYAARLERRNTGRECIIDRSGRHFGLFAAPLEGRRQPWYARHSRVVLIADLVVDGGFFVFGDLSVKKEGEYRLRFSLFEMRK